MIFKIIANSHILLVMKTLSPKTRLPPKSLADFSNFNLWDYNTFVTKNLKKFIYASFFLVEINLKINIEYVA